MSLPNQPTATWITETSKPQLVWTTDDDLHAQGEPHHHVVAAASDVFMDTTVPEAVGLTAVSSASEVSIPTEIHTLVVQHSPEKTHPHTSVVSSSAATAVTSVPALQIISTSMPEDPIPPPPPGQGSLTATITYEPTSEINLVQAPPVPQILALTTTSSVSTMPRVKSVAARGIGASGGLPVILTTSAASTEVTPLVTPIPRPSPTQSKDDNSKWKKFVEEVICHKCKFCGFLALTDDLVVDHLKREHRDDCVCEEDLQAVGQREGIRLHCPRCENTFVGDGSRSFKVHMIDDHGLSEAKAMEEFTKSKSIRRQKCLAALKLDIEEQRIRQSAIINQKMEAYVDADGVLRVRSASASSVKIEPQQQDLDQNDLDLDVTAAKYFSIVKGIDMNDVESGGKRLRKIRPKAVNDIADSVRKSSRPVKKPSKLISKAGGEPEVKKTGRKKGSRTVGISRLKAVNPNIIMSYDSLGRVCGAERCGVRLIDPDKLAYHRDKSHDPKTSEYVCPECPNDRQPTARSRWCYVAMHLWRCHGIDMELLTCQHCPKFRAFNKARLDDHQSKHSKDRPFKCDRDQCQSRFKHRRHLLDHVAKVHDKPEDGLGVGKPPPPEFKCTVCQKSFKARGVMEQHVRVVHEGQKPYSCQYCDFTSGNKSNMVIHERGHTGEKPYSCKFCDYKTADHNSLRKHTFRHTGEKKYKCSFCDFATIQAVNYAYHLKTKHPKEAVDKGKLFVCEAGGGCKYHTINKESYRGHMAKKHDQLIGGQDEKPNPKAETTN